MAENKEKKKPHPGSENLRPLNTRSKEEQRAIQSMGGKKSGEKRREKRTLLERVKWLSNDPDTQDMVGARMFGIIRDGKDADAIKAFVAITNYIEPKKNQIEIGNLDGQPLSTLDMSKLTDDQLRQILAQRQAEDEQEDAEEND